MIYEVSNKLYNELNRLDENSSWRSIHEVCYYHIEELKALAPFEKNNRLKVERLIKYRNYGRKLK